MCKRLRERESVCVCTRSIKTAGLEAGYAWWNTTNLPVYTSRLLLDSEL